MMKNDDNLKLRDQVNAEVEAAKRAKEASKPRGGGGRDKKGKAEGTPATISGRKRKHDAMKETVSMT
jgi:hypothetical protein